MPWDERDIVAGALDRYRTSQGFNYVVTRWPDRELGRAGGPEIDAFAEGVGATPLAIEVTKVESFSGQHFDDARTAELAARLESSLAAVFGHGVSIYTPTGAMRRGIDWADVAVRIERYFLNLVGKLPLGGSRHSVPGVPFEVLASNEPELGTPFSIGRVAPGEVLVGADLLSSMKQALLHKAERLQEYRHQGARAVLIIESHDIALVSHVDVYVAFLKGRRDLGVSHLDDVWFCRTYSPHRLTYLCFLGPNDVLASPEVNLPNLRLGPMHDAYWERAILKGHV